ncbi:MAG: DPP IV N-terminal domain-containing protein, partial [Candidatus Acidiferrales bacterium]
MHRRLRFIAIVSCALLLVAAASPLFAQQAGKKKLDLDRLFAYPRLEGTPPVAAKWSPDSRRLAFLWNDRGMPFRDLWVYDAGEGKLTRLTDLEQPRDQWTQTPADKDPRLRKFLPPEGGLGDFQWAGDSRRLAFAFRGELYVVEVGAAPVRLTRTEDAEGDPKFSPGGQWLAYTLKSDLWLRNLESGETVQLTRGGSDDVLNGVSPFPGGGRYYDWSPDGRWVAFVQTDRTGERTRLIPNYSGVEVATRKQRRTFAKDETPKVLLGVVPAGGGDVDWLMPARREYFYDWRWSPDSKRLALNRVEENWKKRYLEIYVVEGAVRERGWLVYTEDDDKWMCTICDPVEWSPDGRSLLFLSERDGWNHLYLVAAEGAAAPRQLTRGRWEVETRGSPLELRPRFSRDGRWVFFTASKEDLSRRDLYRVRVEGGEPERLSSHEGFNAALVSPDEERIALLFSSFAEPWDLHVCPVAGATGLRTLQGTVGLSRQSRACAQWQRVTTSPLAEFADYEWPQPRIVEFPARDAKPVRALLFSPSEVAIDLIMTARPAAGRGKARPLGRPTIQPVPVINFVHGAGYAQAVLNRWGGYLTERFQFNQFLSQRGYAVIDVDYRGSAGYGRDWRTDVYLHLGGKDLEDELAAMDYLKTLGWVDTSRAGVWGVSYGGFMTLMAMFLSPDTFQAGSAWAAVTDWENYQRHYTQQRLRTPADEPEAYRRSSPIHHVAGLKGRLQLQHGMADDNVHFQDAV